MGRSRALTILRCPVATSNSITKRPCFDKIIQKVFLEHRYDFDPDYPWRYQSPLRKVFLPDHIKAHGRETCVRHPAL